MKTIPAIETERLILREWRDADLDQYAAFLGDPEVTRYLGGTVTRNDAWRGLTNMIGHWVLRGFGLWAVERKSDGVLVGRIGIQCPEGWPGPEVAWALSRPYWGNGYATEAAKAAFNYGFQHFSFPKLISLIDPDNHASQRIAARLGATAVAKITVVVFKKSYVLDVWEVSRDRWLTNSDNTNLRVS